MQRLDAQARIALELGSARMQAEILADQIDLLRTALAERDKTIAAMAAKIAADAAPTNQAGDTPSGPVEGGVI